MIHFRLAYALAFFVFIFSAEFSFAQEINASAPACTGITERPLARASCQIIARTYLQADDYKDIPGIDSSTDIKPVNANITKETELALIQKIELGKNRLREQRKNSSSSRFVRKCFNADNQGFLSSINKLFDSCTLRRSNTRNTIEATQGAQVSFTRNLDEISDDSDEDDNDDFSRNTFEIAAAFRGTKGLGGDTAFSFATEYQRNNTEGDEQANLNISSGLIHDFVYGAELSDTEWNNLIQSNKDNPYNLVNKFYSYRTSLDVAYNRMGVFGDEDSDECTANPNEPFCDRQTLETIRITGGVSPYFPSFNNVIFDVNGSDEPWQIAVSPTASIFYDTALNDNVLLPSGEAADGDVFGLVGQISASLSPGAFENRWQLAVSGQIIEALDRSSGRIATFDRTSREFTSTLSYALIDDAYIGQTQSNRIIPAIAIIYTNGSDSLRGRSSRETIRLAFTALY